MCLKFTYGFIGGFLLCCCLAANSDWVPWRNNVDARLKRIEANVTQLYQLSAPAPVPMTPQQQQEYRRQYRIPASGPYRTFATPGGF